jgi:predicted nucleic acid-binding protein
MYLVGADHPHRFEAGRLLRELTQRRERLVTDAEVFQEILHRFVSVHRVSQVQRAFDALYAVVTEVFPVEHHDVLQAKDIAATHSGLSARDALHVAIMRRHGVAHVLTFDRGFDVVSGIQRIPA